MVGSIEICPYGDVECSLADQISAIRINLMFIVSLFVLSLFYFHIWSKPTHRIRLNEINTGALTVEHCHHAGKCGTCAIKRSLNDMYD